VTRFDATRTPELARIEDCVHCGFCLPTCPTYALWGEEIDSPRGRILLMRAAHEEEGPLTPEMVRAWDNCLGCMACVTACPSGVRYHELIEDTRAQIERAVARPRAERLHRRALFALLPHPGRLRALAPLLALSAATGLPRRIARVPRLGAAARVAPPVRLRSALRPLPVLTPARGRVRGRVGFLQGCVQRVFFAQVNVKTVQLLAAEGFEVHAPRLPRCCGALQLHAGDDEPARALAKRTIEAFEGVDHVVVNAAGCGSAMKDYAHLLRDDPAWRGRAESFSARVRDVLELLAQVGPRAERRPVPAVVAYHDACHLAHAQGVRAAPRELLRAIPGLELREPAEWELCCGSAGVYNLLAPEPARALGERKARNLLATGAPLVAAANPGCALQIAAAARELGRELRVVHPVELVHASVCVPTAS
jgi:glycolate oxidase iron-sulfur subunit